MTTAVAAAVDLIAASKSQKGTNQSRPAVADFVVAGLKFVQIDLRSQAFGLSLQIVNYFGLVVVAAAVG